MSLPRGNQADGSPVVVNLALPWTCCCGVSIVQRLGIGWQVAEVIVLSIGCHLHWIGLSFVLQLICSAVVACAKDMLASLFVVHHTHGLFHKNVGFGGAL